MRTYEKLSSLFSDDLDLPSVLKQKGYQSVFDIVRQSKKVFIFSLRSEQINRATAEAIYDTSAGLATQLYRQFLSTKHQVQGPNTLPGGLMKNGPTWQNLFQEDWHNYCLNNAPESNDSPVSYLVWLYNQALDFEAQMDNDSIISLMERRPDLAQLVVDDAAINQVIPSLQLVNEVLESSVAPYIQDVANQTVNEALSVTRYPKKLPYHYPHQQTLLSLKNSELSLHEVIKKTDLSWPWFTADSSVQPVSGMSLVLGNNLAPEQQTILTEPDNASADDLSAFYRDNFGTVTTDYSVFEDVDFYTEQTKTTMSQLEDMLAANEGGTSVIGSPNVPLTAPASPAQYGAVFINAQQADQIGYTSFAIRVTQSNLENITVEETDTPFPPEKAAGKYADAVKLFATKNCFLRIEDDAVKTAMLEDFSLGFWLRIDANNLEDDVPIVASCYPQGGESGFSVQLNASNQLKLVIQADSNNYGSYTSPSLFVDTWYYIAISWNSGAREGTFYCDNTGEGTPGNVTLDAGNLSPGAASFITFNESGNADRMWYSQVNATPSSFTIDDIGFWDGTLTSADVSSIVKSASPLGDIGTELSRAPVYYAALDFSGDPQRFLARLSDQRMDRINRISRLQHWLGLPFDRVDSLLNTMAKKGDVIQLYGAPEILIDDTYGYSAIMDSQKNQYAVIPDDFTCVGGNKKNFTMGFWLNIHSTPTGDAVICANTEISHSGESQDHGFFLLGSNKQFFLSICDTQGHYVSSRIGYEYDEWNYYIFSVDWNLLTLNICKRTRSSNKDIISSSLDLSPVASTLPEGDKWYFNNDKTEKYYPSFSRSAVIEYDDISIWDKALSADEMAQIASSKQPSGDRNDMRYFYSFAPTPDTLDTLSAGHRRLLGAFRYYADTYLLSPEQFTALVGNIASCAIAPDVPFFDRIFNTPSLFETPFSITNADFNYAMETESDARIVKQICAGLGINTQQLQIVADKVAEYQGDSATRTLSCSLAVVSALYRLVMLPRWLGYGFYDGMALLSLQNQAIPQLASVPHFNPVDDNGLPASGDLLDTLVSLVDLAQWLKANGLTPGAILTLLQQPNRVFPATTAELNFVQDINQQLPASLLSEADFIASGIGEPISTGGDPFVSWMDTLKSVVDNANGLVMTLTKGTKTPYQTLSDAVSAVIAGYTFTSMSNDDAGRILTNIIWQARQEQNGIADSAIANTLQLNVSLATPLLQWCGNTEYDFLCDTLTLNNATEPDDITAAYLQELYQLGRCAAWCHLFNLTPAFLTTYLAHPQWFGLSDTAITLRMAYLFSQYTVWLAAAGNEDNVLAYLDWANALTGDIAPDDVEHAAQVLAALIIWDSAEVKEAAAHANSAGVAASVTDVDVVMRIKDLAERSGSSAQTMIATGALNITSTWDDWQSVGEALIATQNTTF